MDVRRVDDRRGGFARTALAVLCGVVLVASGCTDDGDDGAGDESAATVLGSDDKGYEATIRRTEGGVAHVIADDVADLSFGQGWASAEDRACDLADQVVKINGERARWFGQGEENANIESDLAWRSIGIREIAERDWVDVTDEVRELITAYTDGWNAQLAEVGADGIRDWCAGEPWVRELEPVEVYAYARSVALQASSGAVVDYIATATPPGAPKPAAVVPDAPEGGVTAEVPGSNGWAIGSERSAEGGGMLVANPHFPWEGQLRFWEVHLTVPGEIDVYGVQLSGLPGVGIGFTDRFAWTHTVSAGKRFTAYRLQLVEGSPTTYVYGDEQREMTSTDVEIEVLGEDGEVIEQTHTMWRSHYGPILDFPGVGWSESSTISIRDANIDNDEFIDQYLDMMQADSLDELIGAHEEHSGVPLFNTIAASVDGRAWYADTSATPKLSEDALAAYELALAEDPLVGAASRAGAVLLDGSDPAFEWEEVDGARDPGLVPYSEMPKVERTDYVFNANDSFWMPHATEMLEGDYSLLHGPQRTARSPRTRENATVLDVTSEEEAAGDDERFTLDELADAALLNRGYMARALRDAVVERCETVDAPVSVPALTDDEGEEVLPAAEVDIEEACEVLEDWDGVYDVDRSGPPLWREFLSRFEPRQLTEAGELWSDAFDPARPVETPSGLWACPDNAFCPFDVVTQNLARAVQVLEKAGFDEEVSLGEVQVAVRNGETVPIHGGTGVDGTTNVVGWGRGWSTMDPLLSDLEREPVAPGSSLAEVTGDVDTTGYRINNGTSFLLAVELTREGPRAKAFLTYGNTADREDPAYLDATERFSEKDWRKVLFDADEVEAAAISEVVVRG